MLEEIAWRVCGVSILVDIQHSAGVPCSVRLCFGQGGWTGLTTVFHILWEELMEG